MKSATDIVDLDGLLFLNGKLIVPQSMRKLIFDIAHEGHLGIEKISNLLVLIFIGQACGLI